MLKLSVVLALFAIIFSDNTAHADTSHEIDRLMMQYKKQSYIDDIALRKLPALDAIKYLNKYRHSPDTDIRQESISFISIITFNSKKENFLQAGVNALLDTAKNDHSRAREVALEQLPKFPRLAFAQEQARQTIRQLFAAKPPARSAILIAGIAEDQKSKPYLLRLAQGPLGVSETALSQSLKWAAHLALARLGNKVQIQFCIDTVQKVQDPFAQSAMFLDLDYIRQPQTTRVLMSYLFSDRIVPGEPPDVIALPYREIVLRILARSVQGFPQFTAREADTWLARAQSWSRIHQNNLVIKK